MTLMLKLLMHSRNFSILKTFFTAGVTDQISKDEKVSVKAVFCTKYKTLRYFGEIHDYTNKIYSYQFHSWPYASFRFDNIALCTAGAISKHSAEFNSNDPQQRTMEEAGNFKNCIRETRRNWELCKPNTEVNRILTKESKFWVLQAERQ